MDQCKSGFDAIIIIIIIQLTESVAMQIHTKEQKKNGRGEKKEQKNGCQSNTRESNRLCKVCVINAAAGYRSISQPINSKYSQYRTLSFESVWHYCQWVTAKSQTMWVVSSILLSLAIRLLLGMQWLNIEPHSIY